MDATETKDSTPRSSTVTNDRTAAYVTTWDRVHIGDIILWGGEPAWRTVTGITPRDGKSRYIRTDSQHDPEGWREYWAGDATLVTVRLAESEEAGGRMRLAVTALLSYARELRRLAGRSPGQGDAAWRFTLLTRAAECRDLALLISRQP